MSAPNGHTTQQLHDRLGAMIDQIGHPDYSMREMVEGLRSVRDDLLALRSDTRAPQSVYEALMGCLWIMEGRELSRAQQDYATHCRELIKKAAPQVQCSTSAPDTRESNGKCPGEPAGAAPINAAPQGGVSSTETTASRVAPAVAAPECVVVPREPTPEMLRAAQHRDLNWSNSSYAEIYKAMLAAAPSAVPAARTISDLEDILDGDEHHGKVRK